MKSVKSTSPLLLKSASFAILNSVPVNPPDTRATARNALTAPTESEPITSLEALAMSAFRSSAAVRLSLAEIIKAAIPAT